MGKRLFKILFSLFTLSSILIFGKTTNEIITKNPDKKVEKITANKNRDFTSLNISVNKLNPIKIEALKTIGEYIFFDIDKEKLNNYTYYISDHIEQIPHELKVNNKEVQTEITFLLDNDISIGFPYEIIESDANKDTIKVSTKKFGNSKNIYIALYDNEKKDVFKLYNYKRTIRRKRSYVDAHNFGTVYLGPVNPGFSLYRKFQIAQDLWWFSQADGGRKWGSIDVKNLDNLNVQPLNRKFLDRFFFGSHFDFEGRATYLNMNEYRNPTNRPVKVTNNQTDLQDPVSININNQKISIYSQDLSELYLDEGRYPAWQGKGILRTPVLRSFFREGVFQATDIWYSIYGQLEYPDEANEYIAGMYEIDNTGGKLFFVNILTDINVTAIQKNPIYEKIQFLLQRGTFQSETTVSKNSLSDAQSNKKLVPFTSFKGNLKSVLNAPTPSEKEKKTLFYAEYGGTYTTEIKRNSNSSGIDVNKTDNIDTSGITIDNSLGTGRYSIDLRYRNSHGDYLQYGPNYSNTYNYDTFIINYLDNRPDATATIDLNGIEANSTFTFNKDKTGSIESNETKNGKKVTLILKNGNQIPNTVHKNSLNENAKQKVKKLKITKKSDSKVIEQDFHTTGKRAIANVDDISLGFDANGHFIIQKNYITVGEDTYTVEPFDENDLPLGKITVTINKDDVPNVGDIEYEIDKLVFTSKLNGWLKLDGSFSNEVGSASNKVIPKILKDKSSNINNTLNKIHIKEIISVSEIGDDNNLISARKNLPSKKDMEIFSKDSTSNEESIAIKKGQATLSDFFELKINGDYDNNTKKTFKIIYKDNENKFKSFKIILNVKNNVYHTLKYDVNMSNFPTESPYTFDITSNTFGSDGSKGSIENSSMKIKKTSGNINGNHNNILGLGTAFSKLNVGDITFKIDNESSSSEKISKLDNNYSMDISKTTSSDSNVNGLNMKITKLTEMFPEKTVTLKYSYKNLILLGEIEFKVNSAGKDFVYGEGLLNLTDLLNVVKDNRTQEDLFWYFKLKPHSDEFSKEIDLNDSHNALYISNGRNHFISSFDDFPWVISNNDNHYTPSKVKIEIMNGQFYKFTNGSRIENLDRITIEKDGQIIDTISPGKTFESDINKIPKEHTGNNLRFTIDSNGGLHIGGLNLNSFSGVYKLNFYDNNIKKGEFILTVYSRNDDRPKPRSKSEDTLIVEIDKRVKQLFKDNETIQIRNLSSTPSIAATNNPSGDGRYNQTAKEFINTKMQKGDTSTFFRFIYSATTSNFKTVNDLVFSSSAYNKNGKQVIHMGNFTLFLHRDEFNGTDEVERNLLYLDNNTEKAIKIIFRFVGDEKQKIYVNEDVSSVELKGKITSSHTTSVKDLLIFNKDSFNHNGTITNKITGRETPREYVTLNSTINTGNITYEITRYAKVFLKEKRIYTVKYKEIELQDIEFNILNKGTEGSANIDMSSNEVNVWDNFVLKKMTNKTLTGVNNNFTLTNIEGDLLDTRIPTSNGKYANNTKKIELSDDKNNNASSTTLENNSSHNDGKIQAILGSLKIGIEGGNDAVNKGLAGFLFIDKKGRDYIPKIITIIAKDEKDNILSKLTLKTIIDNPPSVGKVTIKLSGKLYDYMQESGKLWINQNGDIAKDSNDTEKENYKNFINVDKSLTTVTGLNENNKISWESNKNVVTFDINKFNELKNGTKVPKIQINLGTNGRQTEKIIFKSNGVPYSLEYEIIKENDGAENISGSINTFNMGENNEITFSDTNKAHGNVEFKIPNFMNIKSNYPEHKTYETNDYSFIRYNQNNSSQNDKTIGETEKTFSIYKMKMLYNGKNKNEIALTKTSNIYTESFQEVFDVYYKKMKLGTYNISFENTPPVYNGKGKLDLSDLNVNDSINFNIATDGSLSLTNGENNKFTNIEGKFPYINIDNSKLEIKIRKKDKENNDFTTLNSSSNNNFSYTDTLNGTQVLKIEFNKDNKKPAFKITKLSDINNPNSNDTTYEIVASYKNGDLNKEIGKYELTVIRNEKDLGKLILKASPYLIVNPIVEENGKYKIVNNGTFDNKWNKISFDKESEISSVKVNKWLKINEISPKNGKFEFEEITAMDDTKKKESITIKNDSSKNIVDLIKEAKHEYMLPSKSSYTNNNKATEIALTKFTFIGSDNKTYKLDVEYRYDTFEKQTAKASLNMTELNNATTYEFDLNKDTYSNNEITEKKNQKDQKQQVIKLTDASGKIDLSKLDKHSGITYKLSVTNSNKPSDKTNTNNSYKYEGSNYDIELSDSTLKIRKKSDSSFDDNLIIKIEATENGNSTSLIELNLNLKSESKFAIISDKVLDFGIISYSPFDTTNLARGVETFTVSGAKNKTLEFKPKTDVAEMKLSSNPDKKIKVQDIKIIESKKDDLNTDNYFFTMEAFAVTTDNMTPGTYEGEVDVIITIK